MARDPVRLRVGQSPLMRAYLVVFFAVWAVISVGFTATLAADHSPAVVIPTAVLIIELSIAYRALRVSVVGNDDRLVIRNYFSTMRCTRLQVKGVETSEDGRAARFAATVSLQMRDGSTRTLDVFSRPLLTPGSRRRHALSLVRVREWLRG